MNESSNLTSNTEHITKINPERPLTFDYIKHRRIEICVKHVILTFSTEETFHFW